MTSKSRTPSYHKVNYSLRPAKNIERKMIVEACMRLRSFGRLEDYCYVGFGSPFFSDFRIVHRLLGCRDMINIEAQTGDKDRFEFNRPLGCIRMKYGKSSAILPQIRWQGRPALVWLDYDEPINMDMFDDLDYLTGDLWPSSLLLVTVEAKASAFGDGPAKYEAFKAGLEESLVSSVGQRDLAKSRFARTIHRLLDGRIRQTLADRNAALKPHERIVYEQIFNFIYDDGTPMLTFGGVLFQECQHDTFKACDFESLDCYRDSEEAYDIVAPMLTFKEQRALDAQLPAQNVSTPGLTAADVAAYRRVYRYFPAFSEVEL